MGAARWYGYRIHKVGVHELPGRNDSSSYVRNEICRNDLANMAPTNRPCPGLFRQSTFPSVNASMKKLLLSILTIVAWAAILLGPASAFCQVKGVIGVKFGFTAGSGYAVS